MNLKSPKVEEVDQNSSRNNLKLFPCKYCNKSFTQNGTCKYCAKSFRLKESFIEHDRIHTGEKLQM